MADTGEAFDGGETKEAGSCEWCDGGVASDAVGGPGICENCYGILSRAHISDSEIFAEHGVGH